MVMDLEQYLTISKRSITSYKGKITGIYDNLQQASDDKVLTLTAFKKLSDPISDYLKKIDKRIFEIEDIYT